MRRRRRRRRRLGQDEEEEEEAGPGRGGGGGGGGWAGRGGALLGSESGSRNDVNDDVSPGSLDVLTWSRPAETRRLRDSLVETSSPLGSHGGCRH
ncbi:unnamed protein product [Merluccius merluccius]